jgi:3-oxoacyl-[acyl-carrier-protein] synthase-1
VPRERDEPIGVSAVGMCSALGDASTACAAARAGIRRAQALDEFPVFSLADGSVAGLVGHPAGDVTGGFEGFARLLRLTHVGLADLLTGLKRPSARTRVAFYLALAPDPGAGEVAQRLLPAAARIADWPGEPTLAFVAASGRTGVADALVRAADDLQSGRVDCAVVGGVDTLLGEETLVALDEADRLKTTNRAVGLEPGEAAAFLALERGTDGPSIRARLDAVTLARDAAAVSADKVPVGEGLAQAVLGVAGANPAATDGPIWIVSDHNGESLRAGDWGHAIVRLHAASPAFAEPTVWYPATSFGDTGAASGAVAACVVVRAFDRGYAPASRAIAIAAADGAERAAVALHAPGA